MRISTGILALINILLLTQIAYSTNYADINVSGNSISVVINPVISSIDSLIIDDEMYIAPNIMGAYDQNLNPKLSQSLYYSFSIIVPDKDSYSLSYNYFGEKILKGKLISSDYSIPSDKNNSNDNDIEIKYEGIKSGNHIATLRIKALKYDEISNQIIIPSNIQVNIKLNNNSYSSSNFNDYSSIIPDVINPQHFNNWISKRKKLTNFKKYDAFFSENNDNWMKIKINEDGIYQLSASNLASVGAKISNDLINTIKIYGKGGKPLSEKVLHGYDNELSEQEIIVNKNSDGSLNNIIFFGKAANGFDTIGKEIEHYINHYSESNYYLLTWGGADGKRAEAMAIPEGNIVNMPTSYIHRIFEEEELQNPYPFGSGRQWFGRSFFSSPYVNVLHNLDRNGEVLYKISLAHASSINAYYDIFENSNKIGVLNISDNNAEYVFARRNETQLSIPASEIAKDNRSVLMFEYKSNDMAGSTPYFDFYEIHYPRSFNAIENELQFIADSSLRGITEYTLNSFSGSEIYGFDISQFDNPRLLRNLSNTGGIFKFKVNHEENEKRQFFVSSKIKTPEIEKTSIGGLRAEDFSSDVILVTHPDLLHSAEKYKEYREGNSDLSVKVVTTDHIYNEFASGVSDITAIRDFIIHAYHNWNSPPKYVILWGDGHYDFKNLSAKNTNFIPPYQALDDVNSFYELNSYSTDDYFAAVDGEDKLIDLAIGRIPINSDEEGLGVISKISHYENNSSTDQWRNSITLIADDSKAGKYKDGSDKEDGDIHTLQTERLARDYIPGDMNLNKLYLVEYATKYSGGSRWKPGLTDDMLVNINNSGAILLNWIGHGNPRVWAHEFILEREKTIPEMINKDKLFFLTAATCDFGRFDNPNTNSGAEEIFLSEYGGAIGVFSATRLVLSSSNAALNERFYNALFSRNQETGMLLTLGEAYYQIKSGRNSDNDIKYFLLGDPTLRLLIPQYTVKIKAINGENAAEATTPFVFQGLSDVEITAEIIDPSTNTVATDYNGTAIFTIHDGDQYIEMEDADSGDMFKFTKYGGALNRSSYKVENGLISATIKLPKDISFSDVTGRIFAYAYSEDKPSAKGYYNNFKVNGISNVEQTDFDGPEIDIFVDSRYFISGDIVSPNPLLIVDLEDETGINTTGLGIGHRIEAWIDDNPIPIDLTNNFSTSLTNPKKGTSEKVLFNLKAGKHKVIVRAWDIYNNFSESETEFIINPDYEDYLIFDEIIYPNPFSETTNIEFSHNITPPFNSEIKIYSLSGNLVKSINGRITTLRTSQVIWDGTDNLGNKAPIGVYLISIYLYDDENQGISKGLKAIYIK